MFCEKNYNVFPIWFSFIILVNRLFIVLCIMRPSEKVHRNFTALKEKGKQLVCLSYGVESWWTAGLIYVIVGAWKVAGAFLTNQKYFPSIRLLWNVNTSLLNFSSPLGWELDYALLWKNNVLWFDQKFVFMYSHREKKHKAQQSERKANSIVHTYGGWLGKKIANI